MKKLDSMIRPVIQGGMGIGISLGGLAGAVAAEGGMGVISTANTGFREKDFFTDAEAANVRALKAEIKKARDISGGKGLIAINAMTATTNMDKMVETAIDAGIDAIISGAGLPLSLPKAAKSDKVLLAPIVSSAKAASVICKSWEKHHDRRPDFIVIEGSKAGGHLGYSREDLENNETPELHQLLREVLKAVSDIPIFVAGGVFTAEDIKSYMAAGAGGVQIGTRFIATEECDATQKFKDIILAGKEEDAIIIKSPVGMPGRALKTPLIETLLNSESHIESCVGSALNCLKPIKMKADICINCIKTCNPLTTVYCISKALIRAFYGDYNNGLFFCGSNVGRVNKMTTVKVLMHELCAM